MRTSSEVICSNWTCLPLVHDGSQDSDSSLLFSLGTTKNLWQPLIWTWTMPIRESSNQTGLTILVRLRTRWSKCAKSGFLCRSNEVCCFRGLPWIIAAFACILLILFAVLVVFAVNGFRNNQNCGVSAEKMRRMGTEYTLAPSSMMGRFSRAAVVSDNGICSEIGRTILMRGNAIDSAIATAVCIGALHQHSSGIGGGFLMTFYDK